MQGLATAPALGQPQLRWLLDTCVLSEATRPQPNAAAMQWLATYQGQGCISLVTLAELHFGVQRLAAGRRRNQLQTWLGELRANYSERILPTSEPVWLAFAKLKSDVLNLGKPQDDLDLLIAATALVHGLCLVTRNTRHFEHTGMAIVNPWG